MKDSEEEKGQQDPPYEFTGSNVCDGHPPYWVCP